MPTSDPLAVFREFTAALRREEWSEAARLCDPASLTWFKEAQIQRLAPAAPRRELTAEDFMRDDPEMPREVAEYQLARFNRHRDPMIVQLQREFPDTRSSDELREISRGWSGG